MGFLRDLLVRFSITALVHYAADISWPTAGAIGLGAFLLLRTISVSKPAQKTFSISRHRAAAITEGGAETTKKKFEILPRHVGKFGMHDVLIRVHATTFSQSDLSTAKGCLGIGKKGHGTPLILGRECCGEVVAVGDHISNFLPGDMVYAATPHLQGCHAQLVAIDERHVAFKPKNVSDNEAATLPWAAVTAWSAVVTKAGLTRANTRGKRVLVVQNDQEREVSIFALQLLKAWGAHVTLCPMSDVINTSPARQSEADRIVSEEEMIKMSELPTLLRGGYDVVFDTVGGRSEQASISSLKLYRGAVYVSCVSPHDTFVSSLGGFFGELAFSTLYRWKIFTNRLLGGRSFYYSSPEVKGAILEEVRTLVEQGAVRPPQIGAVYTLDEITDAYNHVESGQTPGQVVVAVP